MAIVRCVLALCAAWRVAAFGAGPRLSTRAAATARPFSNTDQRTRRSSGRVGSRRQVMAMKKDLYELLEIPRSADQPAIKKAFRAAARKWHPDVNPSPDAADRFSEISSAYTVLSDPEKRQRYDQFGEAGLGGGGGGGGGGVEVNLEDIFDSFFGGGMGGQRGGRQQQQRQRAGPAPGDDLRADLELSFETAVFGGKERVKIQHLECCASCSGSGVKPGAKVTTCGTCAGNGIVLQVTRTPLGNFQTQTTCPACRGGGQTVSEYCAPCQGQGVQRKSKQVEVSIPCGVDDGNRLRVAGEGDAGARGGAAGDLYIFLAVKPDPHFRRDGQDVYSDLDVSFVDAILGGTAATRTLDESALELKVPAGTQPGTKLRLKSKGIPALNQPAKRGVHYVTVNVQIPTALSPEEEKLMMELRALGKA
ncbi:hypothetical protein M885DRAFT_531638 [Pelagophyceae sp. CCMP2097]|nr:hypothetical protein M885DRAFT_531638 [Pelagophyceae sp. CCMP2097]